MQFANTFTTGRLNHIGIAVRDIDAAILPYRNFLGFADITAKKALPTQGVSFCFVNTPSGGQLEFIEPYGDNSPLEGFLKKHRQGAQHHICFEVNDIEYVYKELLCQEATVLGKPQIGAHGTPVIFISPKDFTGVLIELMQAPAQ